MESAGLKLVSQDGKTIQFPKEFAQFSGIIEEANEDEELPVQVKSEILEFFEVHDWNPQNIQISKPLKSGNLQENLDEKSYSILKDYQGQEKLEKIKPLIDASYYLNCETLKDACLATIAVQYYVGPTEEDLEQFKKKHGLKDLEPEEELQIMQEFKIVFDELNKKFQEEIEEEQKKITEND